MNKKNIKKTRVILSIIVFAILIIVSFYFQRDSSINMRNDTLNETDTIFTNTSTYDLNNIPIYKGNIYIELNNNIPNFTEQDLNIQEPYYSELTNDRAGMAMIKTNWEKANEDEKKDDYTSINPSGYIQKIYDKNIVKGGYLYHRSHIIAWKLGGLDKDSRNIITGTRDFNEEGMKKFEDDIYEYLKKNPQNNVLYRATPYFEGENQLASRNKFGSIIY